MDKVPKFQIPVLCACVHPITVVWKFICGCVMHCVVCMVCIVEIVDVCVVVWCCMYARSTFKMRHDSSHFICDVKEEMNSVGMWEDIL